MNNAKKTLKELIIGIVFYYVIAEIAGLIFVENRLTYSLGLLAGTAGAVLLAYHMFNTLDKALDMDENRAVKYGRKNSFFRLAIMLLILIIAIIVPYISFLAVIIGLLGLKIGAFMQPLINKYISIKIFKEGR